MAAAPGPQAVVGRRAAREAAAWMVRLQGGEAVAEAALAHWRARSPENELAWQRAQQLRGHLGGVDPALALATLDRPERGDRRRALKALAMMAAAVPAAWSVSRTPRWHEWTADHRTAVGERRAIALPDGSRVHLNTATALDVRFDGQARRLVLVAGEIWIETEPDPAGRPFFVETGEGRVRALGTRFVVRQQAGATSVGVFEHAVEIRPAAGGEAAVRHLAAGEQAQFTPLGVMPSVAIDERQATGWLHGVLYADRLPLDRFVAELGRYRAGWLRCDPRVAGLRISGAFQLQDHERVLAALPATLPVSVRYRTPYWATVTVPEGGEGIEGTTPPAE